MPDRHKTIVILSGGAPNSPLMAGVLAAIAERGKTFDVVYASGAGAILGMLFLAPKGRTISEALKATTACGIDDRIYRAFPLGYKTFFKRGPFTTTFLKAARQCQLSNPLIPESQRRFYNDLLDFWFAAATPTDLTFFSKGLCHTIPFIDEVIDFNRLQNSAMGEFWMNAYSIDQGHVVTFANAQITKEHVYAALAFPFVYGPATINGESFYEGSSVEPVSLEILGERINRREFGPTPNVFLIDLLGAFQASLIRSPRNLFDSFAISIITPICALAIKDKAIFELRMPDITLNSITFDVPRDKRPFMLDWSFSNISAMWDIGHQTGMKFVDDFGDQLPNRSEFPQ